MDEHANSIFDWLNAVPFKFWEQRDTIAKVAPSRSLVVLPLI